MTIELWNNPGDDTVRVQYMRDGVDCDGPEGADLARLWEDDAEPVWPVCLAEYRYTPTSGEWMMTASDVTEMPDHEVFRDVETAMAYARAWRDRARDRRFRTADGVIITDGLRVWDYDRKPGRVDFVASRIDVDGPGTLPRYWAGWFRVRHDTGGLVLMDGTRLAVVDRVNGQPASVMYGDPDSGLKPPVSEVTARRVLVIVATWFGVPLLDTDGRRLTFDDGAPELFEPGHNGRGWVIAWEGGDAPDNWPYLTVSGGVNGLGRERAALPPDVLIEAISGCELGIYPA